MVSFTTYHNSLVYSFTQGKGNMETYWLSDKVETDTKSTEKETTKPGLLETDI